MAVVDITILEVLGKPGAKNRRNVQAVYHTDAPVDVNVRAAIASEFNKSVDEGGSGGLSIIPDLAANNSEEQTRLEQGIIIETLQGVTAGNGVPNAEIVTALRAKWALVDSDLQTKALLRYEFFKVTLARA